MGMEEVTRVHTQLMKFGLCIDESRAYWRYLEEPPESRTPHRAVAERWFGEVTERRASEILRQMRQRFDAFPEACQVLSSWRDMEADTRALVCHWHTQLSDPLYRRFTGEFLPARRKHPGPVDRFVASGWLEEQQPQRWKGNTRNQFARKLLGAAYEAGLFSSNRDPRKLVYPRVPDAALSYLLHLLRQVSMTGTLTENPYLRSVGLEGAVLDDRLRRLPGVELRRMGHLTEFTTHTPTLAAWAEQLT